MAAEFFVVRVKTRGGFALAPAHETDLEALKKLPVGPPLRCRITQIRNVDHHRKYFALLNYAFELWEPPQSEQAGAVFERWGLTPEKNFDQFRKDIAILSGFYETTIRLNGEVRVEAKSISFAKMGQEDFEILYDKTIDVLLKHVFGSGYPEHELRSVIEQIEEFS